MFICLKIVLACIFPPLAVAVDRGCGSALCLNIFFTLLGFIPGLIHACCVVCGEEHDHFNNTTQVNVMASSVLQPNFDTPSHPTLNYALNTPYPRPYHPPNMTPNMTPYVIPSCPPPPDYIPPSYETPKFSQPI